MTSLLASAALRSNDKASSTAKKSNLPKLRDQVVVVHRGARDAYQVAQALSAAGLLESLVTDLYWPGDRRWTSLIAKVLPVSIRTALAQRFAPGVSSRDVQLCTVRGLISFVLDKIPHASFRWRKLATRWTDRSLGQTAGQLATSRHCHLLAYSYYGSEAFRAHQDSSTGGDMLFQLHPHPASVRQILRRELDRHPDCAASLQKEWELALPEEEYRQLTLEPTLAGHILAASSFTRQTLVEQGVPEDRVTVIPYGVDLRRFSPSPESLAVNLPKGKLKLLFVGTINQRKGIKYLLEALRLLSTDQIELTVCGRVVDDLSIFRPFLSQIRIRPSVTLAELRSAYQSADLFVFPSVAEGFGQVLLESLASGLPVLSTTHTATPDLIDQGVQGFFVEPRRPDLLAERIEWALSHRGHLRQMRRAARVRAEQFTWNRFRSGVVAAVRQHFGISVPCDRTSEHKQEPRYV